MQKIIFITAAILLLLTNPALADEAQDRISELLKLRNQEAVLINQQLPIKDLESKLEVWTQEGGVDTWVPVHNGRRSLLPAGGVAFVLHLWATWCKPCEKEFPALLELWRGIVEDRKFKARKRVHLLLISEGDSPQAILAFRRRFPLVGTEIPLYGDSGSSLLDIVRAAEKDIGLPLTLLVDSCGVIRQAFSGPILARQKALIGGIKRLAVAHAGLTCASSPERDIEP